MECSECKWYRPNMVICLWCRGDDILRDTAHNMRTHVYENHREEKGFLWGYPSVEGSCYYDPRPIDKPEDEFCHHWEAKDVCINNVED